MNTLELILNRVTSETGFSFANSEKFERAIYGAMGRLGQRTGGVGEKASNDQILAEYDRLGGLIQKNGRNLKIGCFYDFLARSARQTPEVVYVFRDVEGDAVEVPEGQDIPLEVKAAQVAKNKPKKVKRSK